MEKDRITYLYHRYLNNSLSSTELEEFQTILLSVDSNEFMKEVMDDELAILNTNDFPDVSPIRSEQILNTIIGNNTLTKQSTPLWKKVLVAASILMVASVGYYFYRSNPSGSTVQIAYKDDVSPGKNAATLTLSNGKTIRLDDAQNGELAKEAGIVITKSANGQLIYVVKNTSASANQTNTLSTANGETYQVRLPDGSVIWLNSASSVTYAPNLLSKGKRFVKLTGEGFFEVAKDASHPFVVETGNQQVEVLGTHFNINSYQDEPTIETTLLEGSVKVLSDGNQKLIRPGEQVVNANRSLKIKEVNVEQVVDWKEGDFNLTGVDFRVAMRKIARWYDVEMIYDDSIPENIQADGWISRGQKLSAVLDMIEKLGIVHFKIEGKKVYVSR